MTLRTNITRGVVHYMTIPQTHGIPTATNPTMLPWPEFAVYFPPQWEPKARRPLVMSIHGTTDRTTNPAYYRYMMNNFPLTPTNLGQQGAYRNLPDAGLLANGSDVPVNAGIARIGQTWPALADKYNFAVVVPRIFGSGANDAPFTSYGRPYAECSENIMLAIIAYLRARGMVDIHAEIYGHGHSSGGGYLASCALKYPGTFQRLFEAHDNGLDPAQANQDYTCTSGTRLGGSTWDWSEAEGFSNLATPCAGGATTSYDPAAQACTLTAADYSYKAGARLASCTSMYWQVISSSQGSGGAADGSNGSTYCQFMESALSNWATALGYNRVYTKSFLSLGLNAFGDCDGDVRGPTVAVSGMSFFPHMFHDFAKEMAARFFTDRIPNNTNWD